MFVDVGHDLPYVGWYCSLCVADGDFLFAQVVKACSLLQALPPWLLWVSNGQG